jgi:hypothetical protein
MNTSDALLYILAKILVPLNPTLGFHGTLFQRWVADVFLEVLSSCKEDEFLNYMLLNHYRMSSDFTLPDYPQGKGWVKFFVANGETETKYGSEPGRNWRMAREVVTSLEELCKVKDITTARLNLVTALAAEGVENAASFLFASPKELCEKIVDVLKSIEEPAVMA